MTEVPAKVRLVEGRRIVSKLTTRELEVIQYIVRGYSNKQIANTLVITEHTVKNHIKSIFNKTGTSSRTQILLGSVRSGIVKLPQVEIDVSTDSIMIDYVRRQIKKFGLSGWETIFEF